ncbi:DUF1194 domain-containing protein [Roseibium suaedae]|uniref:DUF1194 domain-containing protein n=1 Tax=Roseibium suaedae TaxID=735517 RepID=A0A1M6ZZA1_9HYPH|nr:DUF1194 domain-containing protein [Roseibium suaedae]SHL35665.1 Protein of unknown function [Roseibium suaedae]
MRLDFCRSSVRVAGASLLAGLVSLPFSTPAEALDALRTGASSFMSAYDASREVDVELVLAVDISQSMDTDEQEVQRAGYVAAIMSPDVLEAVRFGPIGRIAVTYMEWGGVDEHFVVAGWTVIEDDASAASFAAQIAEAPLRQVQRTSIASALTKAVEMIQSNDYSGMRQVIDISGDGPNNQGGSVTKARDKLLATGVTINGLPLMMKSNSNAWQAMLNLDHYYEDCVIGGPGSFAIPVRSKEGFADAIKMKLVMEIAGLQMKQPLVHHAAGREPVHCSIFD